MSSHQEKPHKRLLAWQRSMDLVEAVYRCSQNFPAEERYGLTSQIRRAAISAPSNIAEGAPAQSKDEKRRYFSYAVNSLNEVDTQLEIAQRLKYLGIAEYRELQTLLDEALALTFGLRKSL